MPSALPRLPRNLSRKNQCRDKIRHPSFAGAQKHADDLNAKRNQQFEVYNCHFCGHYHCGRPTVILNPGYYTSIRYDILQQELGDRAYFQLWQENNGNSRQRRTAIDQRTRRVYRRLGVPPK